MGQFFPVVLTFIRTYSHELESKNTLKGYVINLENYFQVKDQGLEENLLNHLMASFNPSSQHHSCLNLRRPEVLFGLFTMENL